MKHVGWLLGATLQLVGCSSTSSPGPANLPDAGVGSGSGGGGGSSGAGAVSCSGSPVVWKDDGTTHCASSAEANLGASTSLNPVDGGPETETSMELVVIQNDIPETLSIIVTTSGPISGTYSCTPEPTSVAELTYEEVGVFSASVVSCSITLTVTPTDGGPAIATGTFSAQLTVNDGGMKTLSDGTFDLAVTTDSQ
jgi:hypothetical protein